MGVPNRSRSRGLRAVPIAVLVVGGGVLVTLAGVVKLPVVSSPPRAGARGVPGLVVTRVERLPVGSALREQMQLFDPSPLFMPASVTVGGQGGAEHVEGRLEGDVTDDFPAALRFSETAPAKGILRPPAPATALVAAERLSKIRWFDGLTRQDGAAVSGAVEVRAARVEVYRFGDSERVAQVDIARAEGLDGTAWRPLVLTVLVDVAGAVTQPVVATSSGVDEIDERIRWIVGRELLPRLPLRSGIYRLEVGP